MNCTKSSVARSTLWQCGECQCCENFNSPLTQRTADNGHIRTWQLYDYCSWAGNSFLKDWLSTARVLWNTLFSICHFKENITDWRYFAFQVPYSWQIYLHNLVQVAVFKIVFFWGIFMSNCKKKVDSDRHKNASPLPPWKGTLCRRWLESSPQSSLVKAPAFHFFIHSLSFLW